MHATIAVKTLNLAICTELLSVTELQTCSGKCVKFRPNQNLQHMQGEKEGDRVTPLCGQEAISRVSNAAAPALTHSPSFSISGQTEVDGGTKAAQNTVSMSNRFPTWNPMLFAMPSSVCILKVQFCRIAQRLKYTEYC